MLWGEAAAEQHEKDQPSEYLTFAVLPDQEGPEKCSFCGASGPTVGIGDDGMCINTYKCQERYEVREDLR
jgi:hypothetical protein